MGGQTSKDEGAVIACQTDGELPVMVNGAWGIYFECPRCRKVSPPCAELEYAVERWDALNMAGNIIDRSMVYGQ